MTLNTLIDSVYRLLLRMISRDQLGLPLEQGQLAYQAECITGDHVRNSRRLESVTINVLAVCYTQTLIV